MKPNIKSKYFIASLAAIAAYVLTMIYVRSYASNAVRNDASTSLMIPLSYVAVVCIALAGLFWFKSAKPNATVTQQLLVLLLTPIALTPVLSFVYVMIVLLPIYGLASNI